MFLRAATSLARRGLFPALAAVSFTACGPGDRVEITETRPRHTSEKSPRLDVSYEDSFPSMDSYRWTLPAGWKERPATQFRNANFSFGPQDEGECYLTLASGSELENLNRWRKQMDQPDLTEEQLLAMPRKDIFGRPALFIDLSGSYAGMASGETKENWRLLGVIREEGQVTITVKMTGPADLIAQEAGRFDEFISSLRLTPSYSQ